MIERDENINKDTEQNNQVESSGKKKPGLVYRIIRFTFYSFILLLITFAILLQTTFFKSWLLEIGLEYVNKNLVYPETRIYAHELSGSLFKSIILSDAGIIVKGDTLLKVNSVDLRFDLLKQRPENIHVKKITLDSPGFFMTQVEVAQDSLEWNVSRIFKTEPDTIPDTIPTEFTWKIKVDDFELKNGRFRILADNDTDDALTLAQMRNLDSLNTDYFDVSDLNIKLNGIYSPDIKEFDIKNISFNTNSDFNLKQLSLNGKFDKHSSLREFILITDRTNLKISKAYIEAINIFDGFDYDEFSRSNIELDLLADKFNMKDLYFFLPDLDFMDNVVYLNLQASDNYSNILISKLDLKLRGSDINFAGRLKNLDEPDRLYIDVSGRDITIDPNDTRYNLPGLDIPDFSHLGTVYFPLLKFTGEPLRFDAEFDVRSLAGNANGKVFMDLNFDETLYRGDVQTSEFNIGRIVEDEELNSSINGEFNFDGRGFDYATMNNKITYSLQNTSFFKQEIRSSSGIVEFNSGDITLNVDYDAASVVAKVEGNINIRNLDAITYDLRGESSGLNLAGFTDDASLTSNLNFNFEAKGTGFDPENITGSFMFDFQPSSFAEFEFPSLKASAELAGTGGQTNVDINSEVFDLNASGVFGLTSIANVITGNINYLIAEIISDEYNFDSIDIAYGDTIDNFHTGEKLISSSERLHIEGDVDMRYSISIKNLMPVQKYLDTTLFIQAEITGTLVNNINNFRMSTDSRFTELKYGDSVFIAHNGDLKINLENNYETNVVDGQVSFTSDSLIAGGMFLDTLKLVMNVGDSNRYFIETRLDTNVSILMQGFSEFYKNRYSLIFDSVSARFKDYTFYNPTPNRISFIPDTTNERIRFDRFRIRTEDNQRIDLSGFYSLSDSSDLQISGNNIRLAGLQRLQDPRLNPRDEVIGNVRRVEIDFRGKLPTAELYAELNTDPIIFGNVPFGRLDAIIDMKDGIIKPDISFYNRENIGNLKIYGEIPFESEYSETDSAGVYFVIEQNQPVNLVVDAENFQLDILSKFIPMISNLSGSLNGKLDVTGVAEEPQLSGGLKIKDAVFRFDMTRMIYGFEADIETDKQNLLITGSKLFIPEDPTRFMNTTGYIDLTNLKLNDIDLEMNGTVQLLQRKYGPTGFGIYGDLYGGSGTPKLRVKGNSDEVILSGNLLLISGNVIMDPLGASDLSIYQLYDDNYSYIVNIDSNVIHDSIFVAFVDSLNNLDPQEIITLNPFDRALVTVDSAMFTEEAPASKFLFDIDIKTERNIYLNFIVNERAKNEFFGNVNVDMIVRTTQGDTMSAFGRVELGPNSKYRFYKNFDATGSVDFNGPIADPKLDINAEYRTRTALDQYVVTIEITGNLSNLNPPRFSVEQNGVDIGGLDPSTAAMSIILFGTPQVSGSERNQVLSSIGANIGTMFVSDYVSNLVQEVLPFIVSTNINYVDSRSGNVAQNTSLDVTAEFGDATVRVGGQIFDNINNTNITIEYPLNSLLNIQSLSNNLILQVERVVDPYNTGSTGFNDGTRTGALIYYRIKF